MRTNVAASESDARNSPPPQLARFIAVSGSRQVRASHAPLVRTRVNEILAEQRALQPNASLVVLSTLADGAERIVVEAVLAAGGELIVCLPLPKDEYERTFASDESRHEFAALLKRAKCSLQLPLPKGVGIESRGEPHVAARQSSAIAEFLATHCHILIAVCDDADADGNNGAPQVLGYRLEGIPPCSLRLASALDRIGMGVVYQITMLCTDTSGPSQVALTRRFPGSVEGCLARQQAYERAAAWCAGFSADAARLWPALARPRRDARDALLSLEIAATPSCAVLSDLYYVADSLALHSQRLARRTRNGIMLLALAAALCLQLQTRIESHHRALAMGYLASLGVAWGWYGLSQKRRYETKALEYRAFAEGLRVQAFWELMGVRQPVADYYLHSQQDDLEWIRDALRSAYVEALTSRPGDPLADDVPDTARLTLAQQHWIGPQLEYHRRAAALNRRIDARLKLATQGLLAASLLLAALHVFITSNAGIMSALAMAPALAALVQVYRRSGAYQELSKHYELMARRFQQAERALNALAAAKSTRDPREILFSVGVEAFRENGDWFILRRDRPLKALLPKLR